MTPVQATALINVYSCCRIEGIKRAVNKSGRGQQLLCARTCVLMLAAVVAQEETIDYANRQKLSTCIFQISSKANV